MSKLTKIIIAISIIAAIGLLAFLTYRQSQIFNKQTAIEAQVVKQKELSDGIVRSQAEYVTKKDIEDLAKNNKINLKEIEDDMKKLHAEISTVNTVYTTSITQHITNIESSSIGPDNPNYHPPVCKDGTPCPNVDPYGYLKNQQNLDLKEKFSSIEVPIGSTGFSAWSSKPWTKDIKGREYIVSNIIGTDEYQRNYIYNKFIIRIDGKDYVLPITTAETKQIYPEPKWSWFNPRLFFGISAGATLSPLSGEVSPSLDIGLMSYGKYLRQPDFLILQLGIGYGIVSKTLQFNLTPFSYNVGKHLPLMNNVYLGPTIQIGLNGEFSIMGSIGVAL
jgi:hypothetical protein